MRGRPPGASNVPWASIIERLREHPNRWMLLPEMRRVNARTVNVIRKQERRALRLRDGIIRCRMRSPFIENDTAYGALYLKFEPKEAPTHGR